MEKGRGRGKRGEGKKGGEVLKNASILTPFQLKRDSFRNYGVGIVH